MMLKEADLERLAASFPDLQYDGWGREIEGYIGFCAAYERRSGQLRIGDDGVSASLDTFLCDGFYVMIKVDALDDSGWPFVYEVGGRAADIAGREGVDVIDLHLFKDGRCCLGLRYAPSRNFKIEQFITQLVLPFLYRLSYTDKYGLDATRKDLWGEYSHGCKGLQ